MNTCDPAQVVDDLALPGPGHAAAPVQNLTFADGDATGEKTEGGGGGAIFVRGGRFKVVELAGSSATAATRTGPDLGGGRGPRAEPVHGLPVVRGEQHASGSAAGRSCSNGGALSSIGVSWDVLQQRASLQPRDRQRREPGPRRHARAAAAAAPSTTTATASRSGSPARLDGQPRRRGRRRGLLREQRPHRHAADQRLVAAAQPERAASRRTASPASSSSARGDRRSRGSVLR